MSARSDIEKLYERHLPDAVRLAYLLTGDVARAEDVAQDAFLKSASRLNALRDPERFGAYLRRTVVRTAISDNRSESRRENRTTRAARLVPRVGHVDDVGVNRDLIDAVASLPDRQRAIVVLRFWLDLPEREIAAVIGCAQGTVKSNLSRALQTLQRKAPTDA